ncbi:MAG: hypothetical protein MHM6MM_009104 [Cercozoa sp. M6MM]
MFDPLTGQLREDAVRHACEEDTPGVNALVAETVIRDLFSMDENDCFGGRKRTEVVKLATQVLNRVFKEASARKEKVTLSDTLLEVLNSEDATDIARNCDSPNNTRMKSLEFCWRTLTTTWTFMMMMSTALPTTRPSVQQ